MNQRIASALSYVPADDRDTWVKMAMAVRNEEGEGGFDVWDSWSRTADNYNPSAARAVWRSCRGSGVTIASLFHEAKLAGWRDDDRIVQPTPAQLEAKRRERLERESRESQEKIADEQRAARKAAWIMKSTVLEQHAYLHSKGWPDAKGAVWHPDEQTNLLCIPMRISGHLVGLQLIDRMGVKKYLRGQRTRDAEYLIDNSGRGAMDFYCEGYATGLSLREALRALKLRYRIHITFSANNLARVAMSTGMGYIVADNDASGTGKASAEKTGMPYWISDVAGEDFNDMHKRLGTFRASQAIRGWMNRQGETT